jgi:pyruvate kinase
MIKAGMNVARLNFSHGTYASHALLLKNIALASSKTRISVAIMQDLQGPKIRVKELKRPLPLKPGQKVILGKDFNIDIDISASVKPGQSIFIQDGLIELKIEGVNGRLVHCTAVNAGKIQSHKGVNLPNIKLNVPSLTAKDIKDLHWGLKKNFDMVAISFVRSADDIAFLKKEIKKANGRKRKIVAKIEKPEAVKNIDSIIKASDFIMIARGDLGVEVPEEQVPLIQARIVKKCNRARKPVIVATQMLESMVVNPRPTRAEVEDVADAAVEKADYVMLSEETAFGKYPVEAVREMRKIVKAEGR